METRTPIHVGKILADELEVMDVSMSGFARALDVPPNRISQIIAGRRSITADTALRLGRYFGSSAEFWMNLQKMYELDVARQEIGSALDHITPKDNQSSSARH